MLHSQPCSFCVPHALHFAPAELTLLLVEAIGVHLLIVIAGGGSSASTTRLLLVIQLILLALAKQKRRAQAVRQALPHLVETKHCPPVSGLLTQLKQRAEVARLPTD